MTCVYSDHKLYECPGIDASNSSTSQSIDAQTTTSFGLTNETNNKMDVENQTFATMSSSIANKSTIDQLIESNKMSSWNDIINRNSKYSNNPTQLNSNDILESFNQITTTLSSKLNDDIINLNNSESNNSTVSTINQSNVSLSSNDQQLSAAQFGTRFSSNNSANKSKASSTAKKSNSLTGYEDLATKYQKRKKIKTTTTISSTDDAGETESTESTLNLTSQSSNNSNLTDKTYLTELSASGDQQYSTVSTINDQSNLNNNNNQNNNNHLNHHTDYKEINDQFTSYQFTGGYQANDDLGQPNQNLSTNGLLGSTFNNQFNQYDQSTDSGFKPIFMQTSSYQTKPVNHQFKYVNSKLPFTNQLDTFDSLKSSMNRDNSIHSASSTSNPVLYLESTANITNAIINDSNKNTSKASSNDLIKSTSDNGVDSGVSYQSRENFRMMVKNVSDQKLKDFIKNNDLIDLSSTSISTTQFNVPTNSPQIVPQFLKEKRSRNKMNESILNGNRQNTTGNAKQHQPQFNNNNLSNNWPKSSIQTPGFNKQSQYVNYWPNLNFQNLNKQYNSYNLDNILENNPEYKYDYVFGLSKVLPSFNTNFPPFLPDKNFISKYPFLFNDYFPTELDLNPQQTANNGKIYIAPKKTANNQDKTGTALDTSSSSTLPSWLKSKFSIKSPISRNTNSNSNLNNNQNAQFVNSNSFLHSAASSSFNYPLYELPPPSLLKQKQMQSSMALPLISPTQASATNAQLNNLLNSQFILNNAILPTNTPQTNPQQQQNINNQNTRKTFFSQLSRLFSSASSSRPTFVRVPYPSNLASAFSSLAQPFSKLQIDNISNQLFSPFKGFLNATTPYMPIRKENPSQSSGGNKNAHNDEDDLDELEKHILSANGISPYSLNPQSSINQPTITQPNSNLGQQQAHAASMQSIQAMQNPFNAYQISNSLPPLGQTLYGGPIKRSSFPNNGLSSSTQNFFQKQSTPKLGSTFPFDQQQQSEFFKNYLFQQQQVRYPMMINKKPNEILRQSTNNQFSTIKFPQSSSLPFSHLANRNDLMDDFLVMENEFDESVLNKRKRRRKRSIAYSPAVPLPALHYPPKFSFPFLAPFVNSPPPIPAAYMHSLPPATSYAFAYAPTPVLPPIIPQFSTSISTKPSSQISKLTSSESQIQPQIVASSSSISPTSTQSLSSSSSTLKSSSSLPNISSLSSLSLASAANQLAVSLATISNNISKNHKNTKIAKHLSKLASSSSNFLPVISNLTSSLNSGLENLNTGNKTLPRETVSVWQRPPGKPTFTTWSFSSIPAKELANTFAPSTTRDFPFFNQYNAFRNLPAAAYLVDARPPANLHPFNNQFNSLDLNSFAYHTLPLPNHLTQIPKLQVEYVKYRPMTNFNANNGFSQPSGSKTR